MKVVVVRYYHCHPKNCILEIQNLEGYIQSYFVYLCSFCTLEHQEKQHNQMIKLSSTSYNNPSEQHVRPDFQKAAKKISVKLWLMSYCRRWFCQQRIWWSKFYKKFKVKLNFFSYELLSKACLPVAQLAGIIYPMTWTEKKHLLL